MLKIEVKHGYELDIKTLQTQELLTGADEKVTKIYGKVFVENMSKIF